MKFYKFLVFIAIVITIMLIAIQGNSKANKRNIDYEVIGIIKDISYDIKLIPTIIVGDNSYYLDTYGIRKSSGLNVGDSIYKKSGHKYLEHYKKYDNGFYLKENYKIR